MFMIDVEADCFLCEVRAGAEEALSNTVLYTRAQPDGSIQTDKIKPWISLKTNKGPMREAVKQSVIGRARGLFDSKLHEVKKNITVE
jgi:hypothetical protein